MVAEQMDQTASGATEAWESYQMMKQHRNPQLSRSQVETSKISKKLSSLVDAFSESPTHDEPRTSSWTGSWSNERPRSTRAWIRTTPTSFPEWRSSPELPTPRPTSSYGWPTAQPSTSSTSTSATRSTAAGVCKCDV